jgi:MFS family permease
MKSACVQGCFWAGEEKMRFSESGKKIAGVLTVLAVTQVIGWGTVGLLAVIGAQVAIDLHMDISAVFAGSSILYVVMGLWAPILAKAFTRFGARRVMIAGTVIAAPGFVLLSLSHGPVLYCTAWVILGTAGSATLTTAAYILLNEIAGRNARSAIGALMLVTGLSSSIFLAGHLVSFGRGRLARNLSYLCRDDAPCLPSALRVRIAATNQTDR